jgi:hypothetical protein
MRSCRLIRLVVLAACGVLPISCSSLQAPVSAPRFDPDSLAHTVKEGIELAIRPICAGDDYLDLFDENLLRGGIVAVWVELRNLGPEAIDANLKRWTLCIGSRSFPVLSLDELYRRYYDLNRVRMVSSQADSAARTGMERVIFGGGTVPPATSRAGFVFFHIDAESSADWIRKGSLRARDIRVGQRNLQTIEIPFPHADPRS